MFGAWAPIAERGHGDAIQLTATKQKRLPTNRNLAKIPCEHHKAIGANEYYEPQRGSTRDE